MSETFHFDPAAHRYSDARGEDVPGLSYILERCGMKDYSMVPPAVLEAKRILGQEVHKATHYLDENDLDRETVKEEYQPYVRAYERFKQDSGFLPDLGNIEKPRVVCVDGMRYGFIADRTGIINRKPYVLELKCSASAEPWWRLQTAAQEAGIRSEDGIFRLRMAVQLGPGGNYHVFHHVQVQDFIIFRSCLALENWKRANGKKEKACQPNPSSRNLPQSS
ncbi:MAG: hypothetical protein ACRD2O_08970 [Terriglobia bacterium]